MTPSHGITSYASYLPRYRLTEQELGDALGGRGGSGARPIAAFDEDSTTLAVAAARELVNASEPPGALRFATTSPAYADKTNATAIHAALDLGHEGFAADVGGSARSAVAALRAGVAEGGLVAFGDIRTGRPGSADERGGADAGAALRFEPREDAIAEIVSSASTSAEFLDRWRAPGALASDVWEERFGEQAYMPLIEKAVGQALGNAGLEGADHVVVSSPHSRVARAAAKRWQGQAESDSPPIGYAGAADLALKLGSVLDLAGPGETILLISAVDGCDALVLRSLAEPGAGRRGLPLAEQLSGSGHPVPYTTYLTWRGLIEREPPRRPESDRPAAPPSAREEAWKFGFVGSACTECGRVHVPPRRVCTSCGATDRMERRGLADAPGSVATFTVDRLAFSPSPPLIDVVVDFDGGGRYTLELADAGPDDVEIGTRVEMAFRRLYTTDGVHNYFWKARPIEAEGAES